jgi:hypothetical protein
VKRRAKTPIARFMKNDPIIMFIMKTMKDKSMIGDEQYKIKHNV